MTVWKVAQHLDRKTPIGFFTIAEWAIVVALGGVAFVWGKWISPFASIQLTLLGVVLIFTPLAAKAYLRGLYEIGLGYRLKGAVRVRLVQRELAPGGGTRSGGYVLRDSSAARPARLSFPRRRNGDTDGD